MTRFPNADAWRKACAAEAVLGNWAGSCGVIYQIHSEVAGGGEDVLCMHTAGADTTRLVSAGSSRARTEVMIGHQDRDEPATNILAANQLSRC